MKRTNYFAALMLVLACTTGFFSCKKNKDDDSGKSRTELITSGSWKYAAYTSNPAQDWDGDGITETNILNLMDACERDNFLVFNKNGNGEENEGAAKCDADDDQAETFTWKLSADESKLIIDGDDEFSIVQLTENTLKIKETYVDEGITYTEEITFGH